MRVIAADADSSRIVRAHGCEIGIVEQVLGADAVLLVLAGGRYGLFLREWVAALD